MIGPKLRPNVSTIPTSSAPANAPAPTREAAWTAKGAMCVDHVRYKEFLKDPRVSLKSCLPQACSDAAITGASKAPSVLLLNDSSPL